jgi:hypothetical protein
MSDDLRDRIASAIHQAWMEGADDANALADAVITEVKLDKQFGCPVAGHHFCRCSHRYTTPWKDNE